jgi:hypothetical protein
MIWKALLIDLDFEFFEKAVMEICKEYVDFYPGTNIPALIRKEAKRFKSEAMRKKNTFKEKFDRYKLEAASPEEAKKFMEKAKFKIKEIPKVTA